MRAKTSGILGRRRLLKAGGAAIAGATLGPLLPAERTIAQTRTIHVNTWGGSWTAAEEAAYFKPFTAATGIAVRTVAPVSFAKLKAQVTNEGLVEPIDWTIVQKDKLFPDAVFANGISYCALGTNLCYRKDKFPNGGPRSWADFWDVKTFPGTRSLYVNPARALVFALLADGVPRDKLYPLDVDRAFRKLDQIKPHIKVWWTQGNQSQQLLRDGEIDMMAIWNARASELAAQGLPVELVWNGAHISITMWGVAKGAPNRKLAWEFIQFAVQPRQQAEFCTRLFYGPTNPKAYEFVKPEVARQMPTWPENAKQAVIANAEWEGANAAMLQERFTQWMAG
jgi:putative spermidine/putrescine transport system substrate-binding protein